MERSSKERCETIAATLFLWSIAPAHIAMARIVARFDWRGSGRPVKLMIGGITGWLDEGFTLETGST